MKIRINRRQTLVMGLATATTLVLACGEDAQSGATGPTGALPPDGSASAESGASATSDAAATWPVGTLTFIAGSGATIDLATRLPAGVALGGVFAVDQAGAPLPTGMTLSPSGVLAVQAATVGKTDGVVFDYTEPA